MIKRNVSLPMTFILIFEILTAISPIPVVARSSNSEISYAVIIEAGRSGAREALDSAFFVKWTLREVFGVPRENIKLLISTTYMTPSYVDYDAIATHENVRYYISQWLANQPDYKLFIYIVGHGGGFNLTVLDSGRWDSDGDEGNEHFINGNWKGVDEGVLLEADDTIYWDDEFYEDLLSANGKWVTVLIQSCRNIDQPINGSCYSGGFVDDLSNAYWRTIITASNETGVSWVNYPEIGVSPFTYYFMSAFSDYKILYNAGYPHFDNGISLNWTYKSWRGAFEYALLHDPYYLKDPNHLEFPWFDDDNDGLPTYANGTELADFPWNDQDLLRWLKHDINYDGEVDMKDISAVAKSYGTVAGDAFWNRQADVYPHEDWKVDMKDVSAVVRDFGKET